MHRTLALAAVLFCCLAACAPDKFRATDITGADFARSLQLTGHDGKPYTLQDFAGKVVVVFFGFTHCPDICPTALAKLASVAKALGPDADRLQVLFVTVDPERDTQAALAQYVPAFDPRFLGLHGDADATARTAKEFKVLYQKQAGTKDGTYTVDHSAGTFVFDRAGRVRLFVRHDMSVEDLVHDLKILLDQ